EKWDEPRSGLANGRGAQIIARVLILHWHVLQPAPITRAPRADKSGEWIAGSSPAMTKETFVRVVQV
ncbi:MAG: hypothetical protein KBT60_09715, partial [Methyloceanibacter sp.]|nr:hypothetical protein [Methyloceanibacter sp.]